MTDPVDLTKAIQTRDGRKAVLLPHRSAGGSVFADVLGANDLWNTFVYREDGRRVSLSEGPLDLINVPEPVIYWVNVYERSCGGYNNTRRGAEASSAAVRGRKAVLKLTITGDDVAVEVEKV